MAQKRRKHGKVESTKGKPRLRFQPGVLAGIVAASFVLCFAAYMVSAMSDDTYWEREIVAEMEAENGGGSAGKSGRHANVTNPVPSSERADDSRIGACAFIGDVAEFSTRFETTPGLVFTDAVDSMSESRMRSVARSMKDSVPQAIYIWYQTPEDLEKAGDAVAELTQTLTGQLGSVPVYILTATPTADAETNRKTDTWNAALFSLADENGLHYVDISTMLKANDGTLSASYTDTEVFYQTVYDQILTHVAD